MDELKVKISSDVAGVQTGMSQASAAVSQSVSTMKDSIGDLNGVIKTFSGLIAGGLAGAALKGAIDAATSYNASILSLSRVMGQTTEQASVLATAIKIIGGSTEEYAAMNMRLGMHIKSNAEALEGFGVVLKDGNGHLLSQQEIFDNAIKTMGEYKEGADRNQFALYAFGRGAAEVYKYLNLNEGVMKTATDVANQYGLVIGGAAAQQTKQMSYQLNVLGIIFDAIKIQIGNEVLPTVVSFAGMLGEVASVAIPILVGAIKGILTAFESLVLGFKIAAAVMIGTLSSISAIFSAVVSAVQLIIKGDFAGAWNALKGGASDVKDNFKATWDLIEADATKSAARMKQIWMPTAAADVKGPGKGTKTFTAPEKGKEDTSSDMSKWRDELEQKKMDEKAYFDFSTETEKAFWESKKALATKNNNDLFQINHQIFELEKKDVQQQIADAEKQITTEMALAERSTAAKQTELDKKYQLGEISASQQISGEKELAENLWTTQLELFSKWETLISRYPKEWQKVQDQIALASQKTDITIDALNTKQALETKKTWDKILSPIQSAISTSVQGMILGTTTLQKAIANLGQSILASFIDLGVKELLAWTGKELAKLNISQMYSAALVALGITTATEKEAIETPAAISTITKNAGVAASGAAASQASIPYIGPALAIAAAGAMLGLVMGYRAMASAEGGFDVPAGVNPITQLHSQEMVLPANLAQNVRNMTGGGRGGEIHIHAMDSKDVKRVLTGNSSSVGRAMKAALRRGYR